MTTEQKIRDAFKKHFPATHNSGSITESEKFFFKEGYLALLGELEPVECSFDPDDAQDSETLYRLPKGVEHT